MRTDLNRKVNWLPSQTTLNAARMASEKLLRYIIYMHFDLCQLILMVEGVIFELQ